MRLTDMSDTEMHALLTSWATWFFSCSMPDMVAVFLLETDEGSSVLTSIASSDA
jgi:hypothetical protein